MLLEDSLFLFVCWFQYWFYLVEAYFANLGAVSGLLLKKIGLLFLALLDVVTDIWSIFGAGRS